MNDLQAPRETPRLLNTRDVADMFGVHTRTIIRLVERDELQAIRVGRNIRFEPEAVESFLAAQRA